MSVRIIAQMKKEIDRVRKLPVRKDNVSDWDKNLKGYQGVLDKYGEFLSPAQQKKYKAKVNSYGTKINNFKKDAASRTKIQDAIQEFFDNKRPHKRESGTNILKLKPWEAKAGDPLITSARRLGGRQPHRLWGALDIKASDFGSQEEQQEFITFMLKKGFRILDETKAVSGKRGDFKRNIFHIDNHPTEKGVLRQEVPKKIVGGQGQVKWKTHPGRGGYPIVQPGKKSAGGFYGLGGVEKKVEAPRRQQPVQNKALAEAQIRINELKTADAKDPKVREAKAIAYDDYIRAGGRANKYSDWWRKYLPKKQITETAKVTVTDKDLKHFDDRPEDVDQKTQAPELHPAMEAQKQRQLSLEGSAIPIKNEDIELKKQEQIEEYVPSHTPMESLPEEMKAKESMEEKVSDPQDLIVDYKSREAKKFEEGGSVLKEPELSEDEEVAARQTGDTDIISEAVEDKVEGTVPTPVPQDAWRLKPEETVVQQEVGDLTTKSDKQIKKELKETIEVKSDPGSDVISISPRKSQVQRSKALKNELKRRKQAADDASEAAVKAGIRETESIMAKPEVKVDLKEDVKVEETGDPKAFDLQTYIQQTLQRDDEAREVMRNELSKANESELNIQKVEPFRFWNNMSTPAKIVAGIGMLIGGYAAKDSPAGLQAVMNVIDGAVNADIQAQKLTQEQQLVVAKEATRRAKAAVDKYKAVATSPIQKAKLMELAQALEVKKAGIAKKQQLQALKQYVMNKAREGKIHLVPPALMRMVYPKEEMKRIDTMRGDYEKERKDRKIQPILSAYRRMYRLIDKKEDVSGMDDIAIVFSFMKMLDPNSVVRETEFETAANAGPRAKYFARQWNRFITGGRFTQADRKGFLKSALTLVKPALDEEKQIQRKYVSMARRYGYPSAFIIPPSTRYFDLPGTKDDAAIRKIMKEQGKTRDEAESIHYHVAGKVKKPRYVMRKGVRYPVK